MSKPAEQVLADWLSDAQALRRTGHIHDAELIENFARALRESDAAEWLTWLTEAEAKLRSGESDSWFRRNRRHWRDMGHVRFDKGWYYRAALIPQRKHDSAIREDARRAAQDAA